MPDWSSGAMSSTKSTFLWNEKKRSKQKQLVVGTGPPWFSQVSVRCWETWCHLKNGSWNWCFYASMGWKTRGPFPPQNADQYCGWGNRYKLCKCILNTLLCSCWCWHCFLLGPCRLVPLLRQNGVAPWLKFGVVAKTLASCIKATCLNIYICAT